MGKSPKTEKSPFIFNDDTFTLKDVSGGQMVLGTIGAGKTSPEAPEGTRARRPVRSTGTRKRKPPTSR
jgi:hypothetical protein